MSCEIKRERTEIIPIKLNQWSLSIADMWAVGDYKMQKQRLEWYKCQNFKFDFADQKKKKKEKERNK